jgi:hypothetical protein
MEREVRVVFNEWPGLEDVSSDPSDDLALTPNGIFVPNFFSFGLEGGLGIQTGKWVCYVILSVCCNMARRDVI